MSRLVWKLNRLRVMTFGEILFRIWRLFSTKLERFRLSRGWQPEPVTPIKPRMALFGCDDFLISLWLQHFQLDSEGLENYLEGRIGFFGHDYLSTGLPVNWHREPVTGIESPRVFGKELNYRDDAIVGNVKFLWELGRHQHLVPLAVAYAVSGDTRYKDNISEQISDWIDTSPYGIGIHWCSSLEASLRMLSWSLVHSLLVLRDGGVGLFDVVPGTARLARSIYQHCYFIRHFLSRYSSANNHLIGELTGLWVACSVFDLGERGNQWATFAHSELEHEAASQVYEDGVDKEQAFYYHMWVLEYLLFAQMVAARSDQPFSVEFNDRLHAMLNFLKDVSTNDCLPPQVGDSDDGFVSRFDPAWPRNPYLELVDAADCVFGYRNSTEYQKAFWYHAIADNMLQTDAVGYERSYPAVYKDGGYAILGNKDCHIVMDAGELGYPSIAAHGHADALSFCLAIDGYWWLVDPGTFAYHSDAEWRNYFRGTKAHNTVVVNDLDQSTIAGAFMWTHKARAKLIDVHSGADEQVATGMHDGYRRLGIRHQRSISFNSKRSEIQIIDTISGGKSTKLDICFHFSPEISITIDEITGNWVATHNNCTRRVVFILDKQWAIDLIKGQESPIFGWYSPSLEAKVPAYVLHGSVVYTEKFCSTISIIVI